MNEDTNFRRGACHAADWLCEHAQEMVNKGCTVSQISDALSDLTEVMTDWRNFSVDMPRGNPWEWSKEDLTAFITRRKTEW